MNKNIGEVIKKSVQEVYPKNIIYSIQINILKIEGWKP